MKVYI